MDDDAEHSWLSTNVPAIEEVAPWIHSIQDRPLSPIRVVRPTEHRSSAIPMPSSSTSPIEYMKFSFADTHTMTMALGQNETIARGPPIVSRFNSALRNPDGQLPTEKNETHEDPTISRAWQRDLG